MYVGGRHACLVSCSLFEQESVRGLVDHYNPVTPSKHHYSFLEIFKLLLRETWIENCRWLLQTYLWLRLPLEQGFWQRWGTYHCWAWPYLSCTLSCSHLWSSIGCRRRLHLQGQQPFFKIQQLMSYLSSFLTNFTGWTFSIPPCIFFIIPDPPKAAALSPSFSSFGNSFVSSSARLLICDCLFSKIWI